LRMEISHPEQAFNQSSTTFTAIGLPPLRLRCRKRFWTCGWPFWSFYPCLRHLSQGEQGAMRHHWRSMPVGRPLCIKLGIR